ncbi:MAG: transposase [Candidatus Aminicenantales bacterium]
MPRTRRLVPEDLPLHIWIRGNNKQWIFRAPEDKEYYLAQLYRFKQPHEIVIYHYCLMDNHIHIILGVRRSEGLSRFMLRVNLSYFSLYRDKYGYCGHFFQNRFHSNIIDSDPYLLQCGKYIELNPVRAKMVEAPEHYQFSSYPYYALGAEDPLVSPDPAYLALSSVPEKRRTLYTTFVVDPSTVSSQRLRDQRYIGSDAFIKKAEAFWGFPNKKHPVGRPPKARQTKE